MRKNENIEIKMITTKTSFDDKTSVFYSENVYELYKQGKLTKTETEQFCLRLHDMKKLDKFLTDSGFVIKNKFKDFNFEKADENDLCCYYQLKIK